MVPMKKYLVSTKISSETTMQRLWREEAKLVACFRDHVADNHLA